MTPLVRTRTVTVVRVLISSANLVWVKKLLYWLYSGVPSRMAVMLWAETAAARARRVRRRRLQRNEAIGEEGNVGAAQSERERERERVRVLQGEIE